MWLDEKELLLAVILEIVWRFAVPKEIPVTPFALRQSGSPVSRSVQIVYNGNGAVKVPNKMINITIRAQDGDFNASFTPRNPSKKFCRGVANQTDIIVHITIIETKPVYETDLHTCKQLIYMTTYANWHMFVLIFTKSCINYNFTIIIIENYPDRCLHRLNSV